MVLPYNSEAPVLDTYYAVVAAYRDFLTVAIHTILYERNIYPQASFIRARKYNYPVRQSRHPRVCKWVMDAVAAVEAEMLKVGRIDSLSLVLSAGTPLVHHSGFTITFDSLSIFKRVVPFLPVNVLVIRKQLLSPF